MKYTRILLLAFCTFLSACSVFKTAKNQGEPHFSDFYFMDENGNRVETMSIYKRFVYMVVYSENLIGETISIKLNDDDTTMNYICKGKLIDNRVDVAIRHNKEKIKLEFFNPKNKRHQRIKARTERRKNKKH